MAKAESSLKDRIGKNRLGDVWLDWKWIMAFGRRRRGAVIGYTLFGVLASGLSLLSGVAGKYLIDGILARDVSGLIRMGAVLAAGTVLSIGGRCLTSRLSAKLIVTMQNDIREQVFSRFLGSEWQYTEKYAAGDLINRFSGDVNTVASGAVSWLPEAVIQLFTVLSTLCVILYYDPWMALICAFGAPLLWWVSRRPLALQRKYNRRMRETASDLASFQAETMRGLDALKAFEGESHAVQGLRERQETYRRTALDYNLFRIRTDAGLSAAGTVVQLAALAYCLWRLWRGDILFGTMVLFLQQRGTLQGAVSSLASLAATVLSGSVSAERLRELTELPPEKTAEREEKTRPASGRVVLSHVTAAYREGETVLSGVELEAAPGEVTALIGPSGGGKTTLLRLMLGLIRPTEGELYLETPDRVRFPLCADSRFLFTYVPQGNWLTVATVEENLRLGAPEATPEELRQALADACALDFVERLPQGMQTVIGKTGVGLSEGQAQRLSIARALLRNAPVLLLDEVTSALDPQTEKRVLSHLLGRGVTCILVTHRMEVLPLCSRVYRVAGGTVERVTPDAAAEGGKAVRA